MALLDATALERVRAAVARAEMRTDAEIVTVLCAASDEDETPALLWAALAALLLPAAVVLSGGIAAAVETVLLAQVATFCVGALACRHLPWLRVRLVPQRLRVWRAAAMARHQFLERSLHHTAGESGVLIFVSEAEHYVEILVDRGVAARVDDARWRGIVERFVEDVRGGRVAEGFERAIDACGDVLAQALPRTPADRNELADRLFVIGYD
jgi:putative membrane protein